MGNSTDHGKLQQLTMGAVARQGKNGSGIAVQDELSRASGRDVSVATVYLTLVRLEGQGFVRLAGVEHGPGRGDMGRGTFEITSWGRNVLDASKEALPGSRKRVELE